ncbi:SMP-30/gluconolactonase/LRE family protein [Candidatus Eisenbacteria bacterium]|uniref:SMP-30/gluconolactonase/LRE family protein n=1 Tax=Eiseniibacteriota bacterium TaxID=2212470 RepID=A0ABV6YP20_UNCEI
MRSHRLHVPVAILAAALIMLTASGCKKIRPLTDLWPFGTEEEEEIATRRTTVRRASLTEVAKSDRQWTGVAVSREGRIFVNFPRWSDDVTFSVGEIQASGDVTPFPTDEWNTWVGPTEPGDHFVCVQSVFIDQDDDLWILDAANPGFMGGVAGGAKLVKVDLGRNKIVDTIVFDQAIAPPESYLNDVRVDTKLQTAYITDSGLGAIVVVDLKTKKSRRLLSDHPSTKSEGITLIIEGSKWLRAGKSPKVHSDGLALTSDGKYLYYQALTGRTLYRIETRWLRDESLSAQQLGKKVESMYETGPADGIAFGDDRYLYITAIEDNAVKKFVRLGTVETIAEDPRLKWPDSIARGPDGYLYVTTSQIHLGPNPDEPYRLFKLRP